MQVIDKMTDDSYDNVCAVGAELVKEIVALLKRHGLGIDNAPALVVVASAAVTKGFNIEPEQFASMVRNAQSLWRSQPEGGASGLVYDPPHLRPDFVPAVTERAGAGN